MQLDAALPIVRALADGINPVTGELYPDHSPYAEPRTLRALYSAVDLMQNEVEVVPYASFSLFGTRGKWT